MLLTTLESPGRGRRAPAPSRVAYPFSVPRSPAYTGEERKAVTSPEYASRPSTMAPLWLRSDRMSATQDVYRTLNEMYTERLT